MKKEARVSRLRAIELVHKWYENGLKKKQKDSNSTYKTHSLGNEIKTNANGDDVVI